MQITLLVHAWLTAITICNTLSCYRGTGRSRTNEKSPGHVAGGKKTLKTPGCKTGTWRRYLLWDVIFISPFICISMHERFLEGGLFKCSSSNGNVWVVKFFFLLDGWKGEKKALLFWSRKMKKKNKPVVKQCYSSHQELLKHSRSLA